MGFDLAELVVHDMARQATVLFAFKRVISLSSCCKYQRFTFVNTAHTHILNYLVTLTLICPTLTISWTNVCTLHTVSQGRPPFPSKLLI